jgi:tetratricopeptide (TPR) repeat protein
MMMKRTLIAVLGALLLAGCAVVNHDKNPYEEPLFYTRYLNPNASALDAAIQRDIDALRANPDNAALHNELGQYLAQKGFPKDAEREFERAIDADSHFWPAWYNLSLVRAARGDSLGARFALGRTLHYKPGHSQALFQQGLIDEARGHNDSAIEHYAKALAINHTLLDVRVNPRVLDSKLIHLALLRAYPDEHNRQALMFQQTPPNYSVRAVPAQAQAPSPQPNAENIVTPTAPITDPAKQTPPPQPQP